MKFSINEEIDISKTNKLLSQISLIANSAGDVSQKIRALIKIRRDNHGNEVVQDRCNKILNKLYDIRYDDNRSVVKKGELDLDEALGLKEDADDLYAFGWDKYENPITGEKNWHSGTGTDSLIRLDRRKNKHNLKSQAHNWAKQKGYKGYSIGRLTSHDPDEKHIQQYVPLTKFEEGISKNMTAEDIAKKHNVSVEDIKAQLEKGIKVEKEHTDDEKKAERIALDHLFEIPNYYDKLDKMEKSALKESTESSSNKWNDVFENALDLMEFTLIKYPDGWGLLDRQGGNLGDIEADRFENAEQIIDRLDIYWNDYYFNSIEENIDEEDYPESGLDTAQDILNWYIPEMQKKYPDLASDIDVIELIANHSGDIELEKIYHEDGNEDTVGTAVYEIHLSNDTKKDERLYVHGKIYAVRCGEQLAQKLADTMTKESAYWSGKNMFSIERVAYAPSNEYYITEKEDVEDEIVNLEMRIKDENYVDESLKESINDEKIELYYNDLTITDYGEIRDDNWYELPYYPDEREITIEYVYEIDKEYVIDELIDYLLDDESINLEGDELEKYVYDNFDDLFTKYEDKLLNHFESWAREEAEERYQLDEKLIQGKSDATLKKNIATEIEAGKDPKQAYAIAKSIQRKNMKEDLGDDFVVEEEIWIKDTSGNIIDKLNEKDDFLFFHQFDNQEIVDELIDRYGEDIVVERVHFNEDNLPEESETIYDFDEDSTPVAALDWSELDKQDELDDEFTERKEIIKDGKSTWVKTEEDEEVWNSLNDDDKYFLSMSNDMGFWFDEIVCNEEMLNKYQELKSKFSINAEEFDEQLEDDTKIEEKEIKLDDDVIVDNVEKDEVLKEEIGPTKIEQELEKGNDESAFTEDELKLTDDEIIELNNIANI